MNGYIKSTYCSQNEYLKCIYAAPPAPSPPSSGVKCRPSIME